MMLKTTQFFNVTTLSASIHIPWCKHHFYHDQQTKCSTACHTQREITCIYGAVLEAI